MEELFNLIQTAVADGMLELTLVDEDYGQLQTDEDTYPVSYTHLTLPTICSV